MELLILEGPLPEPISPGLETMLRAHDGKIARQLDYFERSCHRHLPAGRCTADAPCSECQIARRYVHLMAHRKRHGKVLHPSDRVVKSTQTAAAPDNPPATPPVDTWPEPPAEIVYHGLAGEIVKALAPQSEADPVGIIAQLLTAYANMIGRGPHWRVEGDIHHLNLFIVLVGKTAKARKGTSWGRARSLLEAADGGHWVQDRILSGLSSGEGLISAVRDPNPDREDPGATDKRLL